MPDSRRKRRNFTFRGTDRLHESIAVSAAENGRSLSEEIEYRLEMSFWEDDNAPILNADGTVMVFSDVIKNLEPINTPLMQALKRAG